MKHSVSIFSKIWMSLGILIFGYFLSMVVGFFLGQRTISYLEDVSEYQFPAAKKSQMALSAYNEQIKLYKDAVTLGEASFVESADKKASEVKEALVSITQLNQSRLNKNDEIEKLIFQFDTFREGALRVYTLMADYGNEELLMEGDLSHQSKLIDDGNQLQEETIRLRKKIELLEQTFSSNLKGQLADINQKTKHQQYLNLTVFVVVVTTAIILIALIISRSIKKPLQKTFMLENAVKQSVDGIAVIDFDGTLKYGNKAWADMHGYGHGIDELIGQPISMFYTEEEFEDGLYPILESIDKDIAVKKELFHKRKDGSVFPSIITLNLLKEEKESFSIVAIARDITEQKDAERQIQEQAERLRVAMDALWGEMELAKKIQTTLLPESPSIWGYEIAAHMEAASDVGGDYYDIINANGMDWVLIGDVSGHGITAGLVMMMAQTSIQTILSEYSDMKPSKLLTIINRTISDNIKKLGEQKYMTMTALACVSDGKFHFSGLHQDIMIYRKETGSVECIATRGMWIGLVDEIDEMTYLDSLELLPGDVMLLYTDGVTEAVKLNGSGRNDYSKSKMFSDTKLMDLLKSHGTHPPEGIKEGILKELKSYHCDDDVTLVIVKRNEHLVS
ncbi:MAG: SpoIIE family protein phosphatase [Proteobacteria bacterium]|nr:SpoIIE family protein phosphatase [Pseudomonadota bacterium]